MNIDSIIYDLTVGFDSYKNDLTNALAKAEEIVSKLATLNDVLTNNGENV